MRLHAKLVVLIGRTFAEIWPIFDFSRWRPSAILDLFYVYLDHPRKAFVGLCHSAKFSWNRSSGFDNMPVLMFCEFDLKRLFTPFLGCVWGIWPPRCDTILTNLTKVKSTGDSGSIGVLLMLVSVVVPEKLPGQKVVTKKKHMNFWALLTSF